MRTRPIAALRPAALAVLAAFASAATARAQEPADSRPTIAVLYFTNGAIGKAAEYEPLTKGIAEMLITELSASPGMRVVERDRIQKLLEEQDLAKGGRVDDATAARIGKILGAKHMLMGGFIIDPKNNMRLDARSVNTETSQIEYVQSVNGKADDLLALVSQLGQKLNAGLKLPPIPDSPVKQASVSDTPKPNQFKAVLLLSRALQSKDSGDMTQAVALMKQAVDTDPKNGRAKELLASYALAAPSKAGPRGT